MSTKTENVVTVVMSLKRFNFSSSHSELVTRIISACVLIPFILWVTYLGGLSFQIFAGLIYAGALREWSRLTSNNTFHPLCFFAVIGAVLYHIGVLQEPILILPVFITAIYFCKQSTKYTLPSIKRWSIFIAGLFYLTLAMECFIQLRIKTSSSYLILWIYALIWATDSGAYILGKTFKGPKLCPRLSPNKTWSGFIGGTLSATIIGCYLASAFNITLIAIIPISILIIILSMSAHIGDLIESSVKRYFGVKNAGQLIPGHGGILDRLDSLFLVCIIAKVLLLLNIFSF